ncbi:thioredoxin-dependent thiol peroxidase [Candidatus Uhrbacteria bacterium]|nr:thioredoxin-dependent thiol peroxidase [Candidatus Uhrbacteria bacterium]
MSLPIGSKAPAFFLPDHNGTIHSLADYQGKWVLLYFYPKDDTPGCTTEACAIRDEWKSFKKAGIVVLGVSKDSVKSHKKFVEKFDLPFTILADEEKEVIRKYKAWGEKKFMGRIYEGIMRWSYLIDPDGRIAKVYENVKPAEHAGEVLADVKERSSK